MASSTTAPVTLTFSETSNDPAAVVRFSYGDENDASVNSRPPAPGTALVSFLAAPINPQDLMVIAGRYPVKPLHTCGGESIPGYDGVARVDAVGPPPADEKAAGASTFFPPPLQPGDLVIPRRHGLGTWRRRAALPTADLMRIPRGTDPAAAALLRMVVLPAYLLVEDMRGLRPGDWVVQNAGAGAVARLVAQIARLRGCRVCSVVRDRPGLAALKAELRDDGDDDDGALVVLSEAEVEARGVEAHPALAAAAAGGRIVLALDAVFGASGERLAGLLSRGGTYVNYGSLGGADGVVRLSQRLVFWNEVRFRNFRLSEQLGQRTPQEQDALLAWFADLIVRGRLRAPAVERIVVPGEPGVRSEFEDKVKRALSAGAAGGPGMRKHVLEFENVLLSRD